MLFRSYHLVLWGLGTPKTAVISATLVALLPMSVALHSAVSNDPLLFCLVTWALAVSARCVQQGWTTRKAIIVGVLAGLALLTKTSALAIMPVLVVALAISYKSADKDSRPSLLAMASCLVLPILIALPWLMRNQSLYGELFAMNAFKSAFTGNPTPQSMGIDLEPTKYWLTFVGFWTLRSFIGVFGYNDIRFFPEWQTTAAGAATAEANSNAVYMLAALFIFGFIAFAAASYKKTEEISEDQALPAPWKFHLLCGTLTVVVLALYIMFNLSYWQAQSRYIYPAIAPIAAWFGIGVANFAYVAQKDKLKDWASQAWIPVAVVLLALNFLAYQAIVQGFQERL